MDLHVDDRFNYRDLEKSHTPVYRATHCYLIREKRRKHGVIKRGGY